MLKYFLTDVEKKFKFFFVFFFKEKNGHTLNQKLVHLSSDISKDSKIKIYKKYWKTS